MACQHLRENTGEIVTKRAPGTYVEWKVPYNLFLSQDTKYIIDSPSFQLRDVTWYCRMTIYNEKIKSSRGTYGPINLELVRKHSAISSELRVYYNIGLKNADEETYMAEEGECTFYANGEFSEACELLSRLDLCHDKINIAPNDVLTFFCYIFVKKSWSLDEILRKPIFGRPLCEGNDGSEQKCSDSEDDSQETDFKRVHLKEEVHKHPGLDKLGTDLKNLFISGEDSDVTIKVKNKEFKAHKYILRARSPVFYTMFTHDMAEKNSGTVDIADCDPDAFEIFLLYLYSGNMENLSNDTVLDLYRAADKYDAEELKLKCKEFILSSLSVDTVCDILEHAIQYHDAEILKRATIFFSKNFKNIILTDQWQSFLKKNTMEANELLIKASKFYVFRE